MNLFRRFSKTFLILAVAATGVAAMPADNAEAAPFWCRDWKIGGQTWYGGQSNNFSLMFTLRQPPGSSRFGGYARYARGDVNRGGTSSQFLRGGIDSNGGGRVLIDITWAGGQQAQYNAVTYKVMRTKSGGLTAGLWGTAVALSGRRESARFWADGLPAGLGTGDGRYLWPMFCAPRDVVRYPA